MTAVSLAVLLLAIQAAAQSLGERVEASTTASSTPVSEDQKCLKCHESISLILSKKVTHPAVDFGCTTCHIDHQAAGAKSQARPYLAEPQPSLCSECHDFKDKKVVAAHHDQPFDKATCTGCHNPHGSDNPKLINSHEHPPFAARQCEKCHQSPQDGKVRFAAASVSELCEGCHTEFQARYDKSKVKHTFLEIDDNSCITCHRPHATEEPKLLKARVITLCTQCHMDKPGHKKFVHEPAQTNCAICHDPHSSNFHVHLKADVNTLCTACHGLRPSSQNSEGDPLIMPEGLVAKATRIYLDSQNRGHPYMRHPVSGSGIDPSKDKPLSCISCHTPHSGSVVQMFEGELKGNALCLSCHGKK